MFSTQYLTSQVHSFAQAATHYVLSAALCVCCPLVTVLWLTSTAPDFARYGAGWAATTTETGVVVPATADWNRAQTGAWGDAATADTTARGWIGSTGEGRFWMGIADSIRSRYSNELNAVVVHQGVTVSSNDTTTQVTLDRQVRSTTVHVTQTLPLGAPRLP